MTTVVLTRVVPHYRVPLFEKLYDSYGWIVATAAHPPNDLGFHLTREAPWLHTFPFHWPDSAQPNRVRVPVTQILRSTGAQSVISEASHSMSSTWQLPLRRRLRGSPRLMFWSHGWNMERGFTRAWDRIVQRARLIPFRLADGHICYSEEGAAWLRRFLQPDRVFVARNTIDVLGIRKRTAEVQSTTPAGRGPHLLSSGRFTPDKRFDRLVAAFHQFRERFSDATLTIIGDGPARTELERTAGSLLGPRVFLPGAIYDEKRLAAYFKGADLFVYAGAVGLAVNHALAYGLPVVAFDRLPDGPRHHPEIAYVVDDVTGWRVRPATDEALVAVLSERLGRTPTPRVLLAVTLERFVNEHLAIQRMVDDFGAVDRFLKSLP